MRKKTRVAILVLSAALSLPALLAAEREETVQPRFKQEMLTQYKRLQTDVQFQAARKQLRGNVLNRPVVDTYLRALTIPPLEMFNLEMRSRRIDLAVPDFIETYNERWKELHPEAARRYYGEEGARRNPHVASIEQLRQLQDITEKKVVVGPNRNMAIDAAFPPVFFQSEVQIVVNPNNPNQLVAGSNTAAGRDIITCGRTVQSILYSSNGGAHWDRTCAPAAINYGLDCAALGGVTSGSDPALVWNTNNEVFLSHLMICFNGNFLFSVVSARSQDGGATWSARGVVKDSWQTGELEDKEFLAVDNHPESPFSGRLYTCWGHQNDEKIAYSTDGGATWTERDLPAWSPDSLDINCEMAVQKDGTVHVVMETVFCDATDCHDQWLYHTRSSDGGNTWSAPSLVAKTNLVAFSSGSCPDAQNFRCVGSLGAIDVDNSNGECSGTAYVGYSDFPAGGNVNNMDILVRRSTDRGATWSAPVQVNDDGPGGNLQFLPFLSVDPIKGQPVLAWADGREDPANLSMDVYASRSTNCGQKFKKNLKVTQPSNEFNNSTISWSNESDANPNRNGNQFGDYMGVDARNGKAYVAWTDSRHFFPNFNPQRENIAFAVVTFGPPAPDDVDAESQEQTLKLTWKDHPKAADLAGYNVYRVSKGVYTRIAHVSISGKSLTAIRTFSDPVKSPGAFSYAVAAVDHRGEEGPYSQVVSPAGQ
ncbi:MAG TPA: sialidase family protein [Thermoanaerobaculia bacterium]|jgi:hypothetical protein|nr:sialidase family protein [Thermoanaerobaculia bacterium]